MVDLFDRLASSSLSKQGSTGEGAVRGQNKIRVKSYAKQICPYSQQFAIYSDFQQSVPQEPEETVSALPKLTRSQFVKVLSPGLEVP